MKVTIQIATETFVRFWLVFVGFILALYTIYSSWTGLVIVGASFFIAVALYAPVNRLARRLPGKSRLLATLAAFIAIILILSAVFLLAVPPILQQTSKLLLTLPSLVASFTERSQLIGELVQQYNLETQLQDALASMQSDLARWATGFGSNVISSINGLFSVIAQTFLVLVISFLMLLEG
ncbi:AI-2E family transporter, partial [Candidatus Saccharibacteria bacterium]|nr:AI-2E family transporter [Candidatus Saccharibacteria bacterium]